ncbi:type VII secretion target [Williamsia sterculiae]|uniref:Excreted virulence factor EspC, type VII ESX diderm n=1 Tax=Williamsia sterculiae TaxID=1344003 RepID=A0A1N7DXV3_9NOCA|nr:type VII secretion target [Williamsia sterculiae]SIR80505.1 Excreted virulence factor EspC, type VII ESX diderm [Williamsia sterculiae]
MQPVKVDPDTLGAFGVAERTVAESVAGTAGGVDVATLMPTFGIVGSEFLAVLAATCAHRDAVIGEVAQQYRTLAGAADTSGEDYRASDARGAHDLAADRTLRL